MHCISYVVLRGITLKQILRIQDGSGDGSDWDRTKNDAFSEEFLLQRPLLTAIRHIKPTMLLIDATNKADIESEGVLLKSLSDVAVTIPELVILTAVRAPFVALTFNATRELSDAFKRRACSYTSTSPALNGNAGFGCPESPSCLSASPRSGYGSSACCVRCSSRKCTSIAETIDWGRAILALGLDTIEDAVVAVIFRRGYPASIRPATCHREAGVELNNKTHLMATHHICTTQQLAPHRLSVHLAGFVGATLQQGISLCPSEKSDTDDINIISMGFGSIGRTPPWSKTKKQQGPITAVCRLTTFEAMR